MKYLVSRKVFTTPALRQLESTLSLKLVQEEPISSSPGGFFFLSWKQ